MDVYHPKLVMDLDLATDPGSSLGLHAVHRQLQPNTPDEAQPVPADHPDFLGVSWDVHGIFVGFDWDFFLGTYGEIIMKNWVFNKHQ